MTALVVIIPVLNEGPALAQALQALAPWRERGVRLVLCDGGSTDGSIEAAKPWIDDLVPAPRGRARQMNAGIAHARAYSPQAYLFLHADTSLPATADHAIVDALNAKGSLPAWGRFQVRLRSHHIGLSIVQACMNARSQLTGICTGDQAIFCNAALLNAVGGYADIPLMEDIAWSTQARRLAPPIVLNLLATTSARRWERHGIARTILSMWRLRAAYFFGADPQRLAQAYGYDTRPAPPFRIALLAKAPVPGLAKTRLAPALGSHGAARLARRLLLQALTRASTYPLTLWCAPTTQERFFLALQRRTGIAVRQQTQGDIGQRMLFAAQTHFRDHPSTALLVVGSDCPAMTRVHFEHAASALREHDLVFIPANDGGYVLIGMRALHSDVFEGISWSTAQVMEQSRERMRRAGLHWAELASLHDVDQPDDLVHVQHLLC